LVSPSSIIMVDNCYGEFTCVDEPTAFGADIIAGSLIKNPGGGLAHTGGYIAGRRDIIDIIANRITVPGIGREAGCYPAGYLPYYQGLFLAPHTVAQALKTSALFARVFELKGMESMPSSTAVRSDIVQALKLGDKDKLLEFCRVIQSVSPVDSFVVPEPWAMPGYTDKVIMAAGTFVQGSSIELTSDAPIREPYIVYIQGALTYGHGRYAVKKALDALDKM
ncbi:MAG: methionine gamma-lyase family protein, partial [Clostridia bacterium]|nr:methionine gamma-lyase family protein [Clostridia bacterium]